MSTRSNRRDRGDLYRNAGVGVQFAATIGVFAWGGSWLDGRLQTRPWFLIVGVFVGFGSGLASLIYKLSPKPRRTDDDR